ncbi:MAG: deoxyribose-phosphate aldolase, partial [Muribaculaceae bacterium]|nr:deoxyribose-phosphate aldolase [Muribaculaceae bacterium]
MEHNHNHEHEAHNKYLEAINASEVNLTDEQVTAEVNAILEKHHSENMTPEVYQFLLNCVDLTTLATEDSERSVA